MTTGVYLGLGTNLGDRLANLQAAVLGLSPAAYVLRCSPIYQTPPWGYLEQPDFFNQVLEVETDLSPLELLGWVKNLEVRLGRQPAVRYGPRLIDIDILLYGEQVVNLPQLCVPHPRLAERAFVLLPLADLAPGLRPPLQEKTVTELLLALDVHLDVQTMQKIAPPPASAVGCPG